MCMYSIEIHIHTHSGIKELNQNFPRNTCICTRQTSCHFHGQHTPHFSSTEAAEAGTLPLQQTGRSADRQQSSLSLKSEVPLPAPGPKMPEQRSMFRFCGQQRCVTLWEWSMDSLLKIPNQQNKVSIPGNKSTRIGILCESKLGERAPCSVIRYSPRAGRAHTFPGKYLGSEAQGRGHSTAPALLLLLQVPWGSAEGSPSHWHLAQELEQDRTAPSASPTSALPWALAFILGSSSRFPWPFPQRSTVTYCYAPFSLYSLTIR